MENTITLTTEDLAVIQDRSYQAGYAQGEEIGRQNERFTHRREARAQVVEACDLITHLLLKDFVEAKK